MIVILTMANALSAIHPLLIVLTIIIVITLFTLAIFTVLSSPLACPRAFSLLVYASCGLHTSPSLCGLGTKKLTQFWAARVMFEYR